MAGQIDLNNIATTAGLAEVPTGLWPAMGDSRVTAIIPIAGDAYMFAQTGLTSVNIPTMAISGTDDFGTPWVWGSGVTYDYISSTTKAVVGLEGGDHMLPVTACRNMPWTTGLEQPSFIYHFMCKDQVWDKQRSRDIIRHYSTAFLLKSLKGDTNASSLLTPAAAQTTGVSYQTTIL